MHDDLEPLELLRQLVGWDLPDDEPALWFEIHEATDPYRALDAALTRTPVICGGLRVTLEAGHVVWSNRLGPVLALRVGHVVTFCKEGHLQGRFK